MKNRIIACAAVPLLAAVSCVGFLGRGNSAAELVGERVTAEEWDAATVKEPFENYKLVAKVTVEEKTGDLFGVQTVSVTARVDGKKRYYDQKTERTGSLYQDRDENELAEQTMTFYTDSTSGKDIRYEKNEHGVWEERNRLYELVTVDYVYLFYSLYSGFRYDDEEAGYVADPASELYDEFIGFEKYSVLKFRDGKIAGWYMEIVDERENGDYTKQSLDYYITYGGQRVILPAVKKAK